ncbi:hypothetical protein TWF718_004934 [Orbilia javanica]|uniref:Uncharacterized protein n=1 Tax=Orbilia javanica TaxID=47235 RepID=A0AAN8RLC2_9PEZI
MSQRSSAFGGSTMSAASATSLSSSRRFPSALERNNPDVRPSILALVDTSKPISQQVDQIKAATQREAGSPSPRVTAGGSDVFRRSLPGPPRSNASHHSVRSFGSFGLTPSTRRQTSGELGKGDDGLIVAMRRKAAEERRKKHLREVRASQAGSTISRDAFGASRVSNSSFGISRIGLHSSTGSGIRPASSLMGSRSQRLPQTTTAASTATSPHRFEDLRYVQEVLARSRGTSAVSSRASSPEATKPESPYAAMAARARGALFENTRDLQEAKAEKRKEEARRREQERERQRRDARMEMLAKLVAEEEEERVRREEEVLSASNRKRDAAGTLRYSPEDVMDNSVHPYGKEAKDPRKRSWAADSLTRGQQPAKRSRSSEPADEVPRSSDRKLMPPPPAPTLQQNAATTTSPFTSITGQSSLDASFGPTPEGAAVEEEEEGGANDNHSANHSVEPEIGMPVSLFLPSNAPLGGAPIARDFAYPGGPIFKPEPVHAGSDTEPDEDQEGEDDDDEDEEQEVMESRNGNKQPEVVSLLDSDDEDGDGDTFEGFGDYEEEDEEGDDESEEEDEDENESGSYDDGDSDNGEPTIIPICSSPVPESVHDEDTPKANGSAAHILDSFLAGDSASTLTAEAQASDAQNTAPITRSRSSTAQTSSQEKLWMRDSGGRLMRSASPENMGSLTAAQSSDNSGIATSMPSSFQEKVWMRDNNDQDAPNDDDHDLPNNDNHDAPNDDEAAGSELPIDPLLNPGVEVAILAAAHAH